MDPSDYFLTAKTMIIHAIELVFVFKMHTRVHIDFKFAHCECWFSQYNR